MSLRWKIVCFTVLPLVTLSFATLWIVNRSITDQVQTSIEDDLRRASSVLENSLAARQQSLAVSGQVIVQDPKFFSVLAIPGSSRDAQVRQTVRGVANDFNAITQADLFEVTDASGRLVTSVGRDSSDADAREHSVGAALNGRPVSALLVEPHAHYQISVTPAYAGGRVVGALLIGERIGAELAERMGLLTRSDVTFVSGHSTTGSTLERSEDRQSVLDAALGLDRQSAAESGGGTLMETHDGGHRRLTLVRSLPRTDPRQRQFYVMQRAWDVETLFLRQTQNGLVELGIAIVLVALLAGFLIAERITAPVQRLVRGAEEMEHGRYDYPLDVRGRDEIGVLARRFDEMRRRQRQHVHALREADRIKTEFISVASHELRTPISVIQGFQELMLEGKLGEINAQQRRALESTGQCVATLERIAEDATRMAQIEGDRLMLRLDDHDPATLLEQAIGSVRAAAVGRSVEVTLDVPREPSRICVDGPRLVQAVASLVSNGIRYTPDGGRVEVRASVADSWFAVAVRDTGMGIAPEHHQLIFDRAALVRSSLHHHSSRTLEFNSAGLGLGLGIARGIVEAHGGRIEVESAPGRGSTFTVRVPLRPPGELENAA